jgi:glycosyltransferase involved in cell wall biosynthesis
LEESRPLVSIIVRTKDRPKLLKRALQSIASQTYRPIEVVLVNDGGCDLDVEELKEILKDISLDYQRLEKNTGRAHAGNVGIGAAEGTYIGFLDDDDEFLTDHVATLVPLLERLDVSVAYADSLMVHKEYDPQSLEVIERSRELVFSRDFDYDMLLFENYIPFMCLLFRKEVLVKAGALDVKLDLYEDWDLLVRIGAEYPFYHVKKVTAYYNQWAGDQQIAQRNRDLVFLKNSYMKALSGHIDKITGDRIHTYVSANTNERFLLKEDVKNLRAQLNAREARIELIEPALRDAQVRLDALEAAAKERDAYISGLEAGARERDSRIIDLEAAVREKDEHISSVEHALGEKEAYIRFIHSGQGWKLLSRYFAIRDRILPPGTKRRLFAKFFVRTLRHPGEVMGSLNRTNLKKFLNNLKTTDPLTIEKKIEQKLSFGGGGGGTAVAEMTGHSRPSKIAGKNYFNFLFGMHTKTAEDFVPLSYPKIPETDIRVIAFYLPQFHPIKENDEWWGRGFTEWTNVSKAVPQFIGHYQPRLPGELGFYDLRLPGVQARQIELARQYGIHGFCFHFYWFDGKTLLETPLINFSGNFDFPFCINWANENWTRRWDGRENDILIAQKHSPQDDIDFIKHVSAYFKKENYIRIESRPLLTVYRVALLPDPKATGERWRKWCKENGIGDIYLAAIRSFEEIDPESIGFDAVVEFPPHALPFRDISSSFTLANAGFKGVIADFAEASRFYLDSDKPPYKKFRGIMPSWDNEARIPGRGKVLADSTPAIFKEWLKTICHFTDENFEADEKMIFVNAWNEWGEGAYLEPDRRFGYAYLEAVADALIEHYSEKRNTKKILYVCHDAFFAGAQLLSLNIARMLKSSFHYDVHLILKEGGELEPEYAKYATVYNLERNYKTQKKKESLISRLYDLGVREALCNTVVSGDLVRPLREKGIRTVTLVHELPNIIRQKGLEENARLLAEYSDRIVFPSDFVRNEFASLANIDDKKTEILPQGLYKKNGYNGRKQEARKVLREEFSLPESAAIVLGAGFGDHRKGVDLFVDVARTVTQLREGVYFIWIGNLHPELERTLLGEAAQNNHIIFRPALKDISVFYAGADLYLLTSREDPFPSVVMEAMDAGIPVIGFNGAGGFGDIVTAETGALVPYLDVKTMAGEVIRLLDDTDGRKIIEKNARRLIKEKFNFTDYVYALLSFLGHDYKKVSVIVPNYNYERYLKGRLDSILGQTYPAYEIIFLDDASTDESIKTAEELLDKGLNSTLIRNETNSGGAFKQWVKGLKIARGDYIWIAEADDLCDISFVEECLSRFRQDKDVVLAYCQSKQIDEAGKVLAENYFEYTNDINRGKWLTDYTREGLEELSDTLAVKNTIPNISAVLFKKVDISSAEEDLVRFKIAGDWYFYFWLLKQGKIAYVSRPLNFHRRHERGVTMSENKELHYNEVVHMQELIAQNVSVTGEARECALAYRQHLVKYFGLDADTKMASVGLSDEEWLEMNLDPRGKRLRGLSLPSIPPEDVQMGFTGRAGRDNLLQAFAFYTFLRNRCLPGIPDATIMDFGAGWGRLARFFLRDTAPENIYAVDPYSTAVEWMTRTNLPCKIVQSKALPPLPIDDKTDFDLIYSFSVFSHLSEDLFNLWIPHLLSKLKVNGFLVFTTRGSAFINYIVDNHLNPKVFNNYKDLKKRYSRGEFLFFHDRPCTAELSGDLFGEAFVPKQYVKARFPSYFVDFVEHLEHVDQAIVVLRRRV